MEKNSEILAVDRISQLPEHVIHRILALMPYEDAASTLFLSKTWNRVWNSFPILVFREDEFVGAWRVEDPDLPEEKNDEIRNAKEKYMNFIDRSLQKRLPNNLPIQIFSLCFTYHDLDTVTNRLDRWAQFALDRQVRELDICICIKDVFDHGYGYYCLPRTIIDAKSLTTLRLFGCKLVINRGDVIKFSHLQILSLTKMDINEEMIQSLIESCPLIEDLTLMLCGGLKVIQISSLLKLQKFAVLMCDKLERIQINVLSLQVFKYEGSRNMVCDIDLAASMNLKGIMLSVVTMTEKLIHDQILKFPCLEVLELKNCKLLENFKYSSEKLQKLALEYCYNLATVEVDTPNLVTIKYKNNMFPFYPIISENLPKPKLEFWLRDCDDLWFEKLKGFLEKYKHYKDLKLEIICNLYKNVIIHEDLSDIQISALSHLKDLRPKLKISKISFTDLAEFHCGKHLQTLSIVSGSKRSTLLELLCDKILNREEEPKCCRYGHPEHLWHDLRGFSIEKFEDKRRWDPNDLFKAYVTELVRTQTSLKLLWKTEEYPEITPEMTNMVEKLKQTRLA